MIVLVGTLTIVILSNMLLELAALIYCTGYLVRVYKKHSFGYSYFRDALTMGNVLGLLLLAHMMQIGTWALTFMLCGEFDDFETAFYHSSVNFASLGYGDIVMSGHWRLLGGLEAAVGVMMFGVSAALLFAMTSLLLRVRLNKAGIQWGSNKSTLTNSHQSKP